MCGLVPTLTSGKPFVADWPGGSRSAGSGDARDVSQGSLVTSDTAAPPQPLQPAQSSGGNPRLRRSMAKPHFVTLDALVGLLSNTTT